MKIITVGALIPRKHIDWCRETCRVLVEQGETVDWLVIGNGKLKRTLRIGAPNQMRFIDYVPRLRPHFEWADLFVLPSEDEGFGMVYIESVICGTPFVCSKGQGGEEIVNLTGAGVTVDISGQPYDIKFRVAEAVHQALAIRPVTSDMIRKARELTDTARIREDWRRLESLAKS